MPDGLTMDDSPDYILDGVRLHDEGEEPAPTPQAVGRRWIGVFFECCNRYVRIYKNAAGTAYVGHCPVCLRIARVRVGPGGTHSRFFSAS